jgi:O-antigen/teichoic acid export membrane protein
VIFFTPVTAFIQYFIRLIERPGFYLLLSLSKLILTFGLTIYLLAILRMGIISVVYGNIAGLLFMLFISYPVFIRYVKFRVSLAVIKEPVKYAYPQIISGYSNLMIQSGDRYVIRIFNPVNIVGVYSFGYKIAGIVNILLVGPLKHALFPVVLMQEKSPGTQREFIRKAATFYYLLGVFLSLAVALFSKELVMLLARDSEFFSSWVIVPAISFCYIQHGLGNFFAWGLIMKQKPYHITAALICSALVNILLNIILIPIWGIMGAAVASLISYIFWNSLKIYYSAKFYNLYFDLNRLGVITLVGLLLYLSSRYLTGSGSPALNSLVKLLVICAYPLIFFVIGFFTTEEKKSIFALLSRILRKKDDK